MKVLDLNLPSPAGNLACDEALLDTAESGAGGEALRFWESPEYFVVVGYANKVSSEVNVAACETRGIPILRRCSGGGTVLQGPGCLNYALVLRISEDGPARNISAANKFIMQRNRAALESRIENPESRIQVCGHTDLTIGGLKFSGNSQRRRKNFLLFHGTFLLNFNLALVEDYLRMPSLQPDYRADRRHGEFITNLKLSCNQVKAGLCQAWKAIDPVAAYPENEIQRLVADKYSRPEWNRKF